MNQTQHPCKQNHSTNKHNTSLQDGSYVQNQIEVFNIPNQSQLRCHFKIKNIHMPRTQKIEPFIQRLTNHLGIRHKIAYMQLSNCNNKEQLVDYAVGLLYDQDAIGMYRSNTVFKLMNRDKKVQFVRPFYSQAFLRLINSKQIEQQQQQTYVPPLTEGQLILRASPSKKSIEERFSNSLVTIRLVSFPQQITQKDLKSAIPQMCQYKFIESDTSYHSISLREQQSKVLISQGLQVNGIQLLAFPDGQLNQMIASRQLKVCFHKATSILSMLSVANLFKKCGKLVYISELAQPNCFILFYLKEPKMAEIMNNHKDVLIEAVKENEMVNPNNIKFKDKFYEVTRKRNN